MKGEAMKVSEFITRAMGLDDRECEREVWRLAGPANRKFRQEVMNVLSGEKVPLSKCGVNAICEKFKMAKKENSVPVDHGEQEVKQSRHTLMMIAKERGIKNYRVLNKEELMHITAEGITQQEVDALVYGAVKRWKSGWGKGKVKNESNR
jgi:hypothetical protein